MREFQKWAKANGISFKRRRDERSAFEVWNVCQVETASCRSTIRALGNDIIDLQSMLQEIGHIDNVRIRP